MSEVVDTVASGAVIRLDVGTPRTGYWCNACMTSGGVAVPVYQLTASGVSIVRVCYGCLTCKGPGDLEGG